MAISFSGTKKLQTILNQSKLKRWIKQIISNESAKPGEIIFNFCTDEELLKINQDYLNHNTYTDIITFDYSGDGFISGEIFISFERVNENARKMGIKSDEELRRVMIHGILHLCGYKDKSAAQKKTMRKREDEALQLFKKLK